MPNHLITDSNAYYHHNPSQYGHGQTQYASPQGHQHSGGGHQAHQGPHQQGQGGNAQDEEIEKVVKKYLPKVLRQIKRSCCTVM